MLLMGLILSLVLVSMAISLHYLTFKRLVVWQRSCRKRFPEKPHIQILFTITVLFLAHILQVWVFAAAYYGLDHWANLGHITGQLNGDFIDYVYFSAATYTTLGYGDIFPHGVLRMLAGSEALVGLVMITWSGSFTYLMMADIWVKFKKEVQDEKKS